MIKVQDKDLVVPGELIAEGADYLAGEGSYREAQGIYASLFGVVEVKAKFIKVVPLAGRYLPKPGDTIIGVISEVNQSSWIVDLNSPYDAILPLSLAVPHFVESGEDISRYFDIGDVIIAKVNNVTKSRNVALTMNGRDLGKLRGGRIVEINPTKVPRLIGRSGTMVGMIKEMAGCDILVGQNGRVWLNCPLEKENLAVAAIHKIEEEAHIPGLTERVKTFLGGVQ